MKSRLRLRFPLVLAALLFAVPPAAAQRDDGDDDGIRQSVARVSYFEGEVSFNRGDSPDDWQPASVNYPMTLGDRLWAGGGSRVELQLRGATVYLGPETELAVLDLTRDVRQLSLALGTATFRIGRIGRDEVFEVATPNASVTFGMPGSYRIDVDENGDSRVSVTRGQAWAAAAGGEVELGRGEQIRVRGIDRPDYDVVGLSRADGWDRWVDKRARRHRLVGSASYVHPDIYGIDDLDAYGSWENSAEYGSVWYPRGMGAGWEPYRSGRWIWRDPWGWTWLSSEPWGWAPYHYGRWAVVRNRWGWVPVGPRSRYPGYSPALVGFVGGGSGWSLSISAGGFVGWFPLGPREPFDPWWTHTRSRSNVDGFSYAYRNRATVVARTVFAGGGRVDREIVRDARVIRQVTTAPILRGPIPVLPTHGSIRVRQVGIEGGRAIRPPERIGKREVVTRTTPPPAPPTFDRKLVVIRERGGEAVPVDVSRRLSVDENHGEKAARPVRPAARERVVLAPRGDVKEARKPKPLSRSVIRTPVTPATPALGREQTEPAPAPVPQVRQESEPERPTAAPRRPDVRVSPPGRERMPAAEPELKQAAPPTHPAPAARLPKRNVPRPPVKEVEQPEPVPTPRVERVVAPQPRVDRVAPKPAPGRPEGVEPGGRGESERVAPAKPEPRKGKVKPTPKPKKSKERGDQDEEPGKKND